jgi:glycopeptide antibiotics resistance protein
MGSRPNFAKEMDKLLITNFSVLDLSLHTCGHIFGALILRILRTDRIRVATEKLKISIMQGGEVSFHHA